jgi:hypothetical protein
MPITDKYMVLYRLLALPTRYKDKPFWHEVVRDQCEYEKFYSVLFYCIMQYRVDTNPYIFTHPWRFISERDKLAQPANGVTSGRQPTLSGLMFISKNSVPTSQRIQSASIENTSRKRLSRKIIHTCCENYIRHKSLLYAKHRVTVTLRGS